MNKTKLKNGLSGNGITLLAVLIAAALLSIFIKNIFFINIAILVFLYSGLSSSWNIISGYAGQLSLGHAAYFGIGGYAAGILFLRFGLTPWIGMIAGGIVAAVIALAVGYPSLRLRGTFYTLVTIAFAQVVRIVAVNWTSLTGGSVGLHIPFKAGFANMMFQSRNAYALLFLGYAAAATAVSCLIRSSRMGYYLLAIRENQESAEALGISSPKYKSYAVLLSAFLSGIGGALYAMYVVSIDPADIFSMSISTMIAVISIVGGMGTIQGPLIGALIVIPLNELLRVYIGSGFLKGFNLLIYGLVLIVMALRFPDGVYSGAQKAMANFRKRRGGA